LKSRRNAEDDAVRSARPTLKYKTGRLMLMALHGKREFRSQLTMSFTKLFANATPMTAPVNDSISASVSNCRKMRERSAPIAERTASRAGARGLANNRIETFPQPISNNKTTAASSKDNVPPISFTN